MTNVPVPVPYQLRIGITGHRTLTSVPKVEKALRVLIHQIEDSQRSEFISALSFGSRSNGGPIWSRVNHLLQRCVGFLLWRLPVRRKSVPPELQTPVDFLLFSSLAEGADQVAASIFVEEMGADLYAILPGTESAYRETIDSPQARETFDSLLKKSLRVRVANEVTTNDMESKATYAKHSINGEDYLAAGKEVVDSCEILIAVWDGHPAKGTGGTAEVVNYAIGRNTVVLWINTEDPSAPAKRISANEESPTTREYSQSELSPLQMKSANYHPLAFYNSDPAFDEIKYKKVLERESKDLLKCAERTNLRPEIIENILNVLLPRLVRADQLAIRYQELYVRSSVGLYVLSVLAVTCAVVNSLLLPNDLLIGLEICFMLVAVVTLFMSRAGSWHQKWLHRRHLAEHLRSLMFISCLGEPTDILIRRGQEVLPFYQSLDSWVEDAVRGIHRTVKPIVLSSVDLPNVRDFLIEAWVETQANWHQKNFLRKSRMPHLAHRAGLILFLTTLGACILHLFMPDHGTPEHPGSPIFNAGILATTILLPAWGAGIHAINNLLERERIARRSELMAPILQQSADQLRVTQNLEEVRTIVHRVCSVMATENHEWAVSLSFRGPILPA